MALFSASVPVQSIPAGSTATTTPAVVLDNGATKATHTCITVAPTGTYTTGAVQLQLSHDGTNWFNAGTALTLASNSVQSVTVVAAAQFVRAVISTAVSGAGASVGAMVASA